MTWTSTWKSDRGWSAARALAVLAVLAIPVTLAAAETPREVVESTASAVLRVLRNDDLSTEEKRHRIEEIVYDSVDFDTLSKLVLARNWRRLSTQQRDEFEREFKKHLSATYGKNIDDYRNEEVAIVGEREEKRGDRTVQTKVVGAAGSEEFFINYRLRQKDGRWRIIDVVIEGVSLVANFRSQFQSILSSGGPDRLIELLREKNIKGESFES